MRYQYCCVEPKSLNELTHIIDNEREITYQTLKKYVGKEELDLLESSLGYDKYLKLKDDYAVSFHKSKKENGQPVYYVRHSAIEYVFY
jgi:hypothetical protein